MAGLILDAYFHGLANVLAAGEARLEGSWTSKPVRGYASPEQSGTGEGPFIDTVHWQWEGAFEGASPLAGVALLWVRDHGYWVKSHPPAERPAVRFSVSGWHDPDRSVMVTGAFHGSYLSAVPARLADEPPVACTIGDPVVRVGAPHVVGQVDGVIFAIVLLPAPVVKVGRSRLWHLRKEVAFALPPKVHRLLTTARSGKLD